MISPEQERIARLLGQGIEAHRVASAIGVDPSYISQLLSDDEFKNMVQEMRLVNLTNATNRDRRYDGLEDKLLDRIESDVNTNPLAFKSTNDKVRALAIINGLKRRGANTDDSVTQVNQTVIQLMLPTTMMPKFVTSADNQIVQAGEKQLLTMQSKSLEVLANDTLNINEPKQLNKQQVQFYE